MQKNYTGNLKSYEASFSFAKEHFTLDAMVEDVLRIYSKMAKGAVK